MSIELALVISGISLAFGIYQGVSTLKRSEKADAKTDASQLTTVIVKLENIGTGIARIESEMTHIKEDIKEDHERIVKIEEISKQSEKRIEVLEKRINGGGSID